MNQISPTIKKLLFLLFLLHALFVLRSGSPILEGSLLGTDSYMHLNRILALFETGDWYSSLFERSNAPFGEELHWTRLFDIILLAGAGIFWPFLPFDEALHLWGVLVSPILHGVALIGLLWGISPFLSRNHLTLAGGLFVLQPAIFGYCLAGQADHHSFILALLIWLQACTFRLLTSPPQIKLCLAAGILGGLLIWTSIEGFIGLAITLTTLIVSWGLYGKEFSKKGMWFSLGLVLTTSLAMVIERPIADWGTQEYDRFSIVQWSAIALVGGFWTILFFIQDRFRLALNRTVRFFTILSGILIASLVQWLLFPDFFKGPHAALDPTTMALHWNHIVETQPLISMNPFWVGPMFFYLGIALIGIPHLVKLLRTALSQNLRIFWSHIGLAILILTPIAILQVRSAIFAAAFLVIPYSDFLIQFGAKLNERIPKVFYQQFLQMIVVMVGSIGFIVIGATVMNVEKSFPAADKEACPIAPLSDYLNNSEELHGRRSTILTYVNFGPELLYRTTHRVLSTPYHRNMSSIVDTNNIMQAKTEEEAQGILKSREVDLILLCPNSGERRYYSLPTEEAKFYDNLLAGKLPKWINELSLPPDVSDHFRLFAIADVALPTNAL